MSVGTYYNEKDQANTIIRELQDNLAKTSFAVDSLLVRVKSGQLGTADGSNLLEIKNYTLLSYLTGMCHLMSSKVAGKAICDDPSIGILTEDRTVLERIRPIEQKMRYQIDKLIRLATAGKLSDGNPLNFRAQPNKMVTPTVDSMTCDVVQKKEGSDQGSIIKLSNVVPQSNSDGVYIPPKLSSVPYDGDETFEEKRSRKIAAAKRKVLTSNVMHELGSEFLDTPEEVHEFSDTFHNRATREEIERIKYEEELMVRLPETKKDRRRRNELTTDWSLGHELTRGIDLSALDSIDAKSDMKKRLRSSGNYRRGIKKKGNKKPKFRL